MSGLPRENPSTTMETAAEPSGGSKPETSGGGSNGEFQTTLDSLLNPYTQAAFRKTKDDTMDGRSAYTYDFQVQQQNSNWDIHAPDGSKATPSYRGTVWIDKATFNVIRIEEQTGLADSNIIFDK